MLLLAVHLVLATDTEGNMGDIVYEGGLNETSSNYAKGKPVSISHSGGNISVRCMDVDALAARLPYSVSGTAEGPMEAFGKGFGLLVGGDSKGGSVKTRIPSKTSGVNSYEAPLTVNIPLGASAVSVSQSGSGWVQVVGCTGKLSVSSGSGGVYADGEYTSVTMTANGGNAKLVQQNNVVLTGTTAIAAPGGSATVVLANAQGGKLTAKAAEVSVTQTVMGTNSGTLVAGDMGLAGPSITVSAKERVEVSSQ